MEITTALRQFCDYSSFIRGFSRSTIQCYKNAIHLYASSAGVTFVEEVTQQNFRSFMLDVAGTP